MHFVQEHFSDPVWQAYDITQGAADLLADNYSAVAAKHLGIETKSDGTPVTDIDKNITSGVVGALWLTFGDRTIAEEADSLDELLAEYAVPYGTPDAWVLDGVDGTRNLVEGIWVNPDLDPAMPPRPVSLASISLGLLMGNVPQAGIVSTPLLDGPRRMYVAEQGRGAFLCLGDTVKQLVVDNTQDEGIVFVSTNPHRSTDFLAQQKGIVPVGIDGMVFKLMACLDPAALAGYRSRLPEDVQQLIGRLPVIGALSHSAKTHDIAAAWPMGTEAGARLRGLRGGDQFPNAPGKQGIIMATNEHVEGLLRDAVLAESGAA